MSKQQPFKSQIFTPLALVLIVLMLFGWYEFYITQKNKINNSVKVTLGQIDKLYQEELKDSGRVLRALLHLIQKDEGIQSAFISQDRDLLLKRATPTFNEIKRKHGVTQWYFHNLNKQIFVRIHSPERRGENIERWTIVNAAKTQKVTQGIEFSHLGRFAMRVVLPWFVNDKLVGYLELGQELDGIASKLTHLVGGEIYHAVIKSILKKSNWEDGLKMMGKEGDWNQFEDFVFENSTNGSFPVRINRDTIAKVISQEENFITIETNNQVWKGGTVKLHDVSGKKVGCILFLKDTSQEIYQMQRLVIISSIPSAAILIILLLFFYVYIGKIQGKLVKSKIDAEKANIKLGERNRDLEDTRENFKFALQAAQAGTWFFDLVKNDNQWDERTLEIYGIVKGDFEPTYEGWKKLVHPEDIEQAEHDFSEALNQGSRFSNIHRAFKQNGKIVHVLTQANINRDDTGKPIGAIGVVFDITENVLREKEIAESRQKYADLYENAPDMFASVDAKTGTLIQVNQTFLNKTNYSKDEIIGQPIFQIYHPDCLHKVKACFEQFKISGVVHNAELTIRRKDGSSLEVILNVTAITDENGKPIYSRSIWIDISVRKEAEKRVLEAKEVLEMANERLKEVDRLKSMFIASMSHEFRTPLNSIIGFTGILLMEMVGKLEPKQKDFLTRVNQSSKHLLALINDIIDISKVEAGKIESFNSPFILGQVIDEAVNNVESIRNKKGLELKVNVVDNIEVINDRKRVYQCILNYLSNAIKYSEKGWISISARPLNGDAEIVVEDSGIGISDKDLPKLFQPFERLDSTLRSRELGTGLGLYLTKKMASEILGGSVRVESQLGKGSRFFLNIPMNRQSQKNDMEQSISWSNE